ncbi:MAG TPA: TldD/PmbA family protein, partial [Clostridia bacterium]|nr:TldD/PmbA family protein [Clostridia bacterium]
NPITTHPGSVAYLEKILLLEKADRAVRATGSDVKNLDLNYYDNDQRVVIANSEGAWAEDRRVSSRVRVFPTLANETESTGYFVDFTRPAGFEAFQDEGYIDRALRAVGEMRASLRAPEAPYGRFPVVIEGGNPSGTFFHECCGHQLETNQPLLDNGVFLNRLGEKVASEKVTLVDDGTLPGCYGSSKFDDEGMPRQRNVLIENGVLKSYLADRMGSSLLNVPRNACGRREGYATPPAARMSNTYVACGGDDPDEMIRGIPQGLFITRMGGGNGDVDFSILAQTAYWIKNGVLDRQVKRAMLMGRGDEAMLKIDRVGRAMKYGENGMFCGGESGLCPVTTSGARIRIEEMLIGGKGGALSDD